MSNRYYKIFIFSSIVLITNLMLSGCTTYSETRKLNFVNETALHDCSKLPKYQREMCQKIIEKRIAYYNDYIKKHQTYMNKLQSDYKKQVKKISSLQQVKSKDKKLTLAIQKNKYRASRTKELIQNEFKEQQMLSIRSYEEIAGIANTLRLYQAKTQYICKVRDTGRIDCVSKDSLLATYNNEMDKLILSDIDRVHEVYELDFNKALLFECGPGKWGNLAVPDAGLSNFSDFLADQGAENIMDNCSKYGNFLTNDKASSLMGSGGFSGITGIDPFGLSGICGLDAQSSGSFDAIMDQFTTMMETYRTTCESQVGATLMEGEAEDLPMPELEPIPLTELEGTVTNSETDNGDGTTTTDTTTAYSDGTIVNQVKTTDNSTGNTVSQVTTTTRQDDSKVTDQSYHHPDGSGVYVTSGEGADGTKVSTVGTIDNNGIRTPTWGIVTSSDDKSYVMDSSGKWRESKGCVGDEICGTCLEFSSFMPNIFGDCVTSGGRSHSCQAFGNAAGCCSDGDTFPADPRLVIPNPEGNFVCAGGVDQDLADSTCRAQCSVAYHEDCYSNCMDLSISNFQIEFSLLDAICIYLKSEACFIKEGSFPLVLPPIPTPELVEESTARLDPGRTLDYGRTFLPSSIIEHIIVLPDER